MPAGDGGRYGRDRRRFDVDEVTARRLMDEERRRRASSLQRSDDRFRAAVAGPPEGHADDASVLALLAGAEIVGRGRIVYASNAVFALELDAADPHDPARPLRAIYKPARGERPLWDFPFATLHFREVATYLVDAALGGRSVPPTVLRDGPAGPGSVQLFVDVVGRELEAAERDAVDAELHAIAALDVLTNNADRKSAHLLATAQGVRAIDNGLTFLPYPRQRTVLLELGGSRLTDAGADRVRRLAGDAARRADLRDSLLRLLDRDEVDAFEARLGALAADPVYPELDPWEGRPFEWW